MSFIDWIILIIVIILLGLIIYYSIIKNAKQPCKGCPYAKKCDKKTCERKPK